MCGMINMDLVELKKLGEAPDWYTEDGFKTVIGGYLLEGETPKGMYQRVARAAASYQSNPEYWYNEFFKVIWNNWLCPASPVLSNFGSNRGLPISCNSVHIPDTTSGIFDKAKELAMLSKYGAGVGIYLGDIRGRGSKITGGGFSEGVVPWAKLYDTTVSVVSQGAQRRGAAALFLPIDHPDIEEFINIRRPIGDLNRRCLNINHGVCITDDWMQSLINGDKDKRRIWESILSARIELGEPYLFFTDNVNKVNPECYVKNNLSVKTTNICCLAGDTKVLTKTGPYRIESLVGKSVEIWDGCNWVINNNFKCYGTDDLFRIHLADGSYVDCNSNHRWFVSKSYNDIRSGKLHEVITKDLKPGLFIEYHNMESNGDISVDGAYLKGFLLGDGTCDKKNPILNLHKSKYACSESLISSCLEVGITEGIRSDCVTSPGFSKEIDNTGKYASVFGKQIFKKMLGLSARKQLRLWCREYKTNLPEEVFYWDRESKLKFISGLFDADATIGSNYSLQIFSVHISFIKDLHLLLKTINVSSNIDYSNNPEKEGARITLSSADCYRISSELYCNRIKFSGKKPNRKLTGFRRIKKIENLGHTAPVYCTTVNTTGKFALSNGLMTGNSEIFLHTDPEHSFVCCLSSLNLVKYYEWKDTDLIETSIRFLDAVLQEYIEKSKDIPGLGCARNSAIKGRALGLGVLGWHTLLQSKMIPFESFDAMCLNNEIFKLIKEKSDIATKQLANELGEPEWCKGFGVRNTHCISVAPTVSNSTISGGHSAGIEPIAANIYSFKSAKGTFIKKNPILEKLLESKGINTIDTWKSIISNQGSVQHLKDLTEEEKSVFLTAREINQFAIINQAAQRQKYIDQGQSVNLFFASNADPKYIHKVHLSAWEQGLKSLYYCRSEGVLRGDLASRSSDECLSCHG